MKSIVSSLVLACLAFVPALAHAETVRGVVTTKAGPPEKTTLEVTTQKEVCGKSVPNPAYAVKDGKVQWAVVSLEKVPAEEKVKSQKRTLDQKGCEYVPHVLTATKGDKLIIVNSDPVLHNVHATSGKKTLFNLAMPIKGQKITKRLKKTGTFHVGCDAGHSWMSAYIVVFDHPFHAVTGEEGSFTIENVPPGTYTLKVWHETLGEKTVEVEVKEGAEPVEIAL